MGRLRYRRRRGITIKNKNEGAIVYVDGVRLKKPVVESRFVPDYNAVSRIGSRTFKGSHKVQLVYIDDDYETVTVQDFTISGNVVYIRSKPIFELTSIPEYTELYQKLLYNLQYFSSEELGGFRFYPDCDDECFIEVYKDGWLYDDFNDLGDEKDYNRLKEFLDKPVLRKLKKRIEQDTNNYLEEDDE